MVQNWVAEMGSYLADQTAEKKESSLVDWMASPMDAKMVEASG